MKLNLLLLSILSLVSVTAFAGGSFDIDTDLMALLAPKGASVSESQAKADIKKDNVTLLVPATEAQSRQLLQNFEKHQNQLKNLKKSK